MRAFAIPPPPNQDRDLSIGIKWSVIAHIAIAVAILLKGLVFPGNAIPFIPTLRVDIVDLPDVLKKDKSKLLNVDRLEEQLKKAEQDAKKVKKLPVPEPKAEEAKPDEMVKNPRAKQDRQKKMKSALDRLKALDRISEEEPKPAPLIKGNMISKGMSTSDDAKESGEASYLDALRQHLQENWSLPVWLSRQKLAAQVQLFIDSFGRLQSYKFIRSSGNPQFDEAVMRTLRQSQPFPKPPRAIADSLASNGILVGFPL